MLIFVCAYLCCSLLPEKRCALAPWWQNRSTSCPTCSKHVSYFTTTTTQVTTIRVSIVTKEIPDCRNRQAHPKKKFLIVWTKTWLHSGEPSKILIGASRYKNNDFFVFQTPMDTECTSHPSSRETDFQVLVALILLPLLLPQQQPLW